MVSAGARKILLCHVICGSCGVLCFPSWPALLLEMCATKERWEQRSQKLHIVWRFRIWCDGVFLFFLCQNFVVAVGAEGWFHLFDLTAAATSKADSSSQHEFQSPDDQKPFLTQHIPANTKVILISDIGKFSLNSSVINVDFCDFLSAACACLQMEMGAASWWWDTQTEWCEPFAGRSRLTALMQGLVSWFCWRNGFWRDRWAQVLFLTSMWNH